MTSWTIGQYYVGTVPVTREVFISAVRKAEKFGQHTIHSEDYEQYRVKDKLKNA